MGYRSDTSDKRRQGFDNGTFDLMERVGMKILIAPDSFKESLSAEQVVEAIEGGFKEVFPDVEVVRLPIADGGEGTTKSLVTATKGRLHQAEVTGPLGGAVNAHWGMLGNNLTAVIETAAASGLDLVPRDDRNPMVSTSRGTGELILAALDSGVQHIIVGLGGSATNDGGAGMLQALGVQLLDSEGNQLPGGGGGLGQLHSIDTSLLDPRLSEVHFDVACDVDNPLIGPQGASAVFGPQKGATQDVILLLDNNLKHFAEVVKIKTGLDVSQVPGAGAAGGLGAALLAFLNAELKSGIDIVLDAVDIDAQLIDSNLVITGEGRIDSQSARGKTIVGVARRAKLHQCPVVALAGSLSSDSSLLHEYGIDALFSIMPGVISLDDALENAAKNLCRTARNVAMVWAQAR